MTIAVKYATTNYKDGMIINGIGGSVGYYPHIPGVDFCGVVQKSSSSDFTTGDEVFLTDWRVGEIHSGGFATLARVKS